MEISSFTPLIPFHFKHTSLTSFVAHSRLHFSCEEQLFFISPQQAEGTHIWFPLRLHGRERDGSRWQSSGLPNVYSTVLENNFGKWPNGVDITTQMSHVSVKRIGKQAYSPWRRNGNVNTSSSVKWVVSVYDPEGVVEGICVGSMLVWGGGGVYTPCVYHLSETQL